jgi:hypothetical protein
MLICTEISLAITYHVVNGRLDLVNLFPVKLDMHEMSGCRKRSPCISVFKALERCEGKRLVIDNSMKASEALRTLVLN